MPESGGVPATMRRQSMINPVKVRLDNLEHHGNHGAESLAGRAGRRGVRDPDIDGLN